jgi:hypothetical protein
MKAGWACHVVRLQLLLAIAVTPTVILAQVSVPTDADKQAVPLQFRPEDQKNGAITSFAPRGTPAATKL